MPIPKNLMKRIEQAIKKIEDAKMKNNFFVFRSGEKPKNIPDKSLVIELTRYEPETTIEQ